MLDKNEWGGSYTMQKVLKFTGVFMFIALIMVVVVACGDNNANNVEENANNSQGAVDNNAASNNGSEANEGEQEEALSGTVIVDGSGTVYPLMARIAEEYITNEQTD